MGRSDLKQSSNDSIMVLPPEILFNIFLRLPVKSLLRCKSVCHSWRQLVCDPYFVKIHASRNQSPKLLLRSFRNSFYTVDHEKTHGTAVPRNFPLLSPDFIDIACSCNGLLCLTVTQQKCASQSRRSLRIVLWNPLTGDYKLLPDVEPPIDDWQRLGFGYDSLADDYKLVRIVTHEYIDDKQEFHEGECRVDLYSLKDNYWKNIRQGRDHDVVSFHVCSDCPFGVWVPNGSIYWEVRGKIIAFDLNKEKFRELSLPAEFKKACDKDLFVVGGCLGMCYMGSAPTYEAFVWMVKEDGDKKERLIKLMAISCKEGWWPAYFLENGKVLLFRQKEIQIYGGLVDTTIKFFVYDPKGNIRYSIHGFSCCIRYPIHGISRCKGWAKYTESLVSPNRS